MKKTALTICLIAIIVLCGLCVGCGEYGDFAGTYVRNSTSFTATVTLSSSGNFTLRRVWKKSEEYNPYNNEKYNNISGTFTPVDNKKNQISIEFTYFKNDVEGFVKGFATGSISGNKLVITKVDSVAGTYIKQ